MVASHAETYIAQYRLSPVSVPSDGIVTRIMPWPVPPNTHAFVVYSTGSRFTLPFDIFSSSVTLYASPCAHSRTRCPSSDSAFVSWPPVSAAKLKQKVFFGTCGSFRRTFAIIAGAGFVSYIAADRATPLVGCIQTTLPLVSGRAVPGE